MAEAPLRLGTRGSALALAQAELVAKALGDAEIVTIRTSGDEGTRRDPPADGGAPGGDKARFVREIERALIDGEVDLGVHSAKDLPTELPDGLELAGVPAREDPRDAYVGDASSLGDVPEGSRIGTSSLRRRAQILALRPDVEVVEVRGNVDTRLAKLEAGDYDGLVLAAAGLRRLSRAEEIAFPLELGDFVPAPGQGRWQSRRGTPTTGPRPPPLRSRTAVSWGRSPRSGRWWPPSRRAATRPWARTPPSSRVDRCGFAPSAGCRTAASGYGTRWLWTPPIPRRSAARWRSG